MVEQLTVHAAVEVAYHLRARDIAELRATQGVEWNALEWAQDLADLPGEQLCFLGKDLRPVAMGGLVQIAPRLATGWFVATDRIDEARVAIHYEYLRLLRRGEAWGMERTTVVAMTGDAKQDRWIYRLGFSPEGVHPRAGINGETLVTWGRLAGGRN